MPIITRRVTISIILTLIITTIGIYSLKQYSAQANELAVARIDVAITEHLAVLATLAESTRSNSADSITNRFVVDCNAVNRQRFDTLLDSLSNTISSADLAELNTLFYSCGSFYADRRATMAIKLAQAVEYLAELIDIESSLITVPESRNTKLNAWKQLSEAELKTAEYFQTLVALQGKIISDLRSGKSSNAPEIIATLTEVNSVRGQMLVLSKQIEVNKLETQ